MHEKVSSLITIVSIITIFFVPSCKTEKQLGSLVYFNQSGDTTLAKIVQNAEPVIQPSDRLSIVVNALNPASAIPYNLGSSASSATNPGGYIVESDGTIQFPQLGKLHVAGMHRKQLIDTLTGLLTKFVTDPVVTVQFLNFKITVLGEVNRQGTYNIPDGKVTLLEALGLAGDLPITARRDNITVIRERNGQREFGKVNLLSKNTFSSPYYMLQQNDVVYVELTQAKVAANDQTLYRNVTLTTSILSIVTTLVVLIINVTN